MAWTWTGFKYDPVFRFKDKDFFQTGQSHAEARFWKIKIHEEGDRRGTKSSILLHLDNFVNQEQCVLEEKRNEAAKETNEAEEEVYSSENKDHHIKIVVNTQETDSHCGSMDSQYSSAFSSTGEDSTNIIEDDGLYLELKEMNSKEDAIVFEKLESHVDLANSEKSEELEGSINSNVQRKADLYISSRYF